MQKHIFALAGLLVFSGCKEKAGDAGGGEPKAENAAVAEGVVLALEDDPMPEGEVLEEDFRMETKGGTIVITLPDQEMKGTLSVVETKRTKKEGLAGNKIRISILEDKKTESAEIAGQKQPEKVTESALTGHSVIAEEEADGTWTVELEDGEASAEMEKRMRKLSEEMGKNLNAKVYGTEPREVGEEWEVEGAEAMGIKDGKGTFKMKFESIEDFQGERCAKLTGSMDITGKTPEDEEGAPRMDLRLVGDFTVFRSIENRVDLSNVLKGKMEVSGELTPQPGMVVKMKMEGPMEATGSSKVTKAE